ncbi:MAG: hypothetical protein KAT58_07320, partial [candidate division Zixibacteria bacterium]|nr:hypothetical protein [candidate division Zixibacteria bacterium]
MTSSDKQSPRVYENGDKLCSDICVWCGAKEGLSESHLFPKCIGGSFAARISCQECNSFLGTKFESEAKKNASITAALVKLGIADRRSAYRLGKKLDTESGVEMHIAADGKSKPVTRQVSDNRFEGSPEQNKAFALRHFRKTRPKWSTKPLEEFYDDPSKQKFTYAGEQYTKKHYPAGDAELAVQMQRHPHPNLIFKIIYEFLALFNLQSSNMIQSTLEHLVTVDANNRKDRIV